MRSRARGFWTASWVCLLSASVVAADGVNVKTPVRDTNRSGGAIAPSADPVAIRSTDLASTISPLPPGAKFASVILGDPGADGSASAAPTLIYSNTLGPVVFGPTVANQAIADDIITTAVQNCSLDKFVFRVSGDKDGTGVGGAFSVSYALYDTCPGATFTPNPIPGTAGTFNAPDNGFFDVTVVTPVLSDIKIPASLYLGLRFSRTNTGVVFGAPALQGFSADRFDWPARIKCGSSFPPGFPATPHSSFYAKIFARGACARQFPIYSNSEQARSPVSPGAGKFFADNVTLDIDQLGGQACLVSGYEVTVKATGTTGSGVVSTDLRGFLDLGDPENGGVLAGSVSTAFVFGKRPQQLRVTFDPPLSLTSLPDLSRMFVGFKTSSSSVGPVLTCRDADIGSTQDLYQVFKTTDCPQGNNPCWDIVDAGRTCTAAMDVTIYCAGEPPAGACCDMVLTENKTCVAGPNDGQPCAFPGDCPLGNCAGDSVCRDIARINCPFPKLWGRDTVCASTCVGGSNDGQPCERQLECPGGDCPGPFIGQKPCGLSQCCTVDDNCFNLTEKECFGLPPIENSKVNLYRRGEFCGEAFDCPFGACLGREGECTLARPAFCIGGPEDGNPCDPNLPCFQSLCCSNGGTCTGDPGCENPDCCTTVCARDSFCCQVFWDSNCATTAAEICTAKPANDECFVAADPTAGAVLLPIPTLEEFNGITSTSGATDPGFCCKEMDPGGLGANTIWFKFVAPAAPPEQTTSSVQITTCGSGKVSDEAPGDDSILQGFAVGAQDAGVCSDGLTPCTVSMDDCPSGQGPCVPDKKKECQSLTPIGCNDNVGTNGGCGAGPTLTPNNSRMCLQDLVPGDIYYFMLGATVGPETLPNGTPLVHKGKYRVTITSPCSSSTPPQTNDLCPNAELLTGSSVTVPFDLSGSSQGQLPADFDCPGPECLMTMFNDIWYDWVAPATGEVTIDTCSGGVNTPDTAMVVYEGCDCPVDPNTEQGCSDFVQRQDCTAGSEVIIPVIQGTCYKIRLGGRLFRTPAGDLALNFRPCPTTDVTFLDPPDGVVDARQPFEPGQQSSPQGIISVLVSGAPGTDNKTCWALCETGSGGTTANDVRLILDNGDGTFTVRLNRPITNRAATTLTFLKGDDTQQRLQMFFHPGNVDAGPMSETADIPLLADMLRGLVAPPWGAYSMDTDRTGMSAPADLLRMIDMRNAAASYPSTRNIPIPPCGICCPTP